MTQTITPSVTPTAMRRTLAGFATGLSVVAAEIDGQIVGMPANSLTSVSLAPHSCPSRSRTRRRPGPSCAAHRTGASAFLVKRRNKCSGTSGDPPLNVSAVSR